eukprot:Skav209252  [mRNA]  locus=scaffold990:289023:292199:- [translate_table: standard]
MNIFVNLPSTAILPTELNRAITLPLGKTPDSDTAAATRPITLLPLIQRLWSRVTTQQVLQQWKPLMTPCIVGFLPGRSPQKYMLKLQHELERIHAGTHDGHVCWQGITLDLVKCFNLFPRLPAKLALTWAGIPPHFVDQWYHTLNNMSRWWKVNDNYFDSGRTCTGTPEGDAWSVLCCISIARLWISIVESQEVSPYSYADNWAWRAMTDEANLQALESTKAFCASLRMRIDWSKTWVWHTRPATDAWLNSIQALCPTHNEIQHVRVARELGSTVNYNKAHSRMTQRARHDQALSYIHKAKQPHLSVASRSKLCFYAITKALWGTESYVVGQSWFSDLRTAIGRTLVPDKPHCNAWLACMLLSHHIVDPEFYHIMQCIRSCRNMLQDQTPNFQDDFFAMAAHHDRKHTSVWGPAGALSFVLSKIGWNLQADGTLETDSLVNFHLLHSPRKCLMRYLEHAWMKHLVQCKLQRPEWSQLPVPDRQATLQWVKACDTRIHATITEALTGASMLAKQVSHIPEAYEHYGTDQCALCGATDTIEHRALTCSATEAVRQQHIDIVQHFEEHNPCHVNLPVMYENPWYDFHAAYFHSRPPPDLTEVAQQQIQQQLEQHGRIVCYTDGSCAHPNNPPCRRATFAVVLDCSDQDTDKVAAIQAFACHKIIPDTFQVCMLGEVRGTQSSPRAELQALAAVAALDSPTILHTDCQYAIDAVARIRITPDIRELHTCANYDVLLQLAAHVRRDDFTLVKVTAHSFNRQSDSIATSWMKLGNEAADRAAKDFLTHVTSTYPLDQCTSDRTADRDCCLRWYTYLHDLQIDRAKLFQNLPGDEPLGDNRFTWEDQFLSMQFWMPEPALQYPYPDSAADILPLCVWGSQYSDLLLRWLAMLYWPRDATEGDPCSLGVTWYELALSFLYSTQFGIIINIGKQHADFKPHRVEVNDPDVPWATQVTAFEKAISSLQSWFEDTLLPLDRCLSKGFRVLGGSHGKHGLTLRPHFPYQEQICDSIKDHLQVLRADTGKTGGPEVPTLTPLVTNLAHPQDIADLDSGWHQRINRARRASR